MTENYEALGRYTKAVEDMSIALRERNRELMELKRLLARVVDNDGWDMPINFDFDLASSLLQSAETAHDKIEMAVIDANSSAILAKKKPLQWR